MRVIICGDGPMGRALADELREAGDHVQLLGRPAARTHDASSFAGIDVVHEFSVAGAVVPNLRAAVAGGCRRFVIGTTGWSADRGRVEAILVEHGATAVAAPTFSPGATVLLGVAADVSRRLAPLGGFEPFIVEWHRRPKRDRPSGTAAELARRMAASGAADEPIEIASVRAGSAPGMHVVGFDAPGETLELRLTARDRRCYAAGARLAGEWLAAAARSPGLHPFESVVDDLLAGTTEQLHERINA